MRSRTAILAKPSPPGEHWPPNHDQADMPSEDAVLLTTLLTPVQVAERLSISRATVYELMLKGDLRSLRIGRCRRVRLADVAAFIDGLQDT